jgi:hypothetical protein
LVKWLSVKCQSAKCLTAKSVGQTPVSQMPVYQLFVSHAHWSNVSRQNGFRRKDVEAILAESGKKFEDIFPIEAIKNWSKQI